MTNLLRNFIKDDGSLNVLGQCTLYAFALCPDCILLASHANDLKIEAWFVRMFWIWGMCGLLAIRLLGFNEKPFYRWSKNGENRQHKPFKKYLLDLFFFGSYGEHDEK